LTESPLFAAPTYRSFEVHRTAGADCLLICFATPEDAAAIRAVEKAVEVRLYPDAYNDATELLAVSYSRLTAKKLVTSREPGNWVAATVSPIDRP
jgi:hypothetical protein